MSDFPWLLDLRLRQKKCIIHLTSIYTISFTPQGCSYHLSVSQLHVQHALTHAECMGHKNSINDGCLFFFQIQTQPETQSLEGHIPGGARVNWGSLFPPQAHPCHSNIACHMNLTKHFSEPKGRRIQQYSCFYL